MLLRCLYIWKDVKQRGFFVRRAEFRILVSGNILLTVLVVFVIVFRNMVQLRMIIY